MRLLATIALLISLSYASYCQTPIDVQQVKELKRGSSLGTCGYAPVAQEKNFIEKLSADERETGSFMAEYTIHGKSGKYISWFGVVRGITGERGSNSYSLLLEHKYFDGMTDCHIMLVSHSGSGDFTASVKGNAEVIPALSLVRVYGKVVGEKDGVPEVATEYVRVWPWLTFTFTDLGAADHSNPRWAQFCKLCKNGRIYKPYPNEEYFLQVLGNPTEFGMRLSQK